VNIGITVEEADRIGLVELLYFQSGIDGHRHGLCERGGRRVAPGYPLADDGLNMQIRVVIWVNKGIVLLLRRKVT
jgi:hypothetical protein